MPFDFPVLSIGDPGSYMFYVPLGAVEFANHISAIITGITTLWWLSQNWDAGYDMNEEGAGKFDDLCGYCAGLVQLNQLVDPCFTEELIADWCETHYQDGSGDCHRAGMSNADKNKAVQDHFQCFKMQNIQKVEEIAEDYLSSYWSGTFPWI